ncbi:hypothetical protein VCRA2119O147_10094 [Vibrio crassostreae]|uniref:Uncharacterized protein n=1 Tax=Vibrio crassostreae TaxID=246167 RepID=A0A822N0T2_9VIBR|nr:hypothetical protein VCRA2113O351_100035 [Vibrio crassostreae]CAK1696753.1 hypothetical protein VCRA2117O38_100049 [Vibrio crassostreae]CAK1703756.1 hypothetical protein VCRA2116O26_100116 [Vibrio crassostreae]CAK1703822.1 hypothetical protein VCRA2119O46_100116 [Vibrio crassostreae]CAK1722861.1 hypothetical protein VCRA2117O39_110116 [Vibrio crassostreae]
MGKAEIRDENREIPDISYLDSGMTNFKTTISERHSLQRGTSVIGNLLVEELFILVN